MAPTTKRPTDELEIDDGPLRLKFWKVWPECLVNCGCCLPCNSCLQPLRRAVSRKKLRYEQEGWSLDLVYLDPRLIIMGFPAVGVEHLYRNPRREVARFLNSRHEGKYHVFNFCSEAGRGYPSTLFRGAVSRYPFQDHFCPPLQTMIDFCEAAMEHLNAAEDNVVAVHCKAGKGRAGLMACCLMIRMGKFATAEESMDYYDVTRVRNRRGLTVPSQRKYVGYYERCYRYMQENGGLPPPQPSYRVTAVRLKNLHSEPAIRLQLYRGTNFGADLQSTCAGTTEFSPPPDSSVISGNVYLKFTRPAMGGLKWKKHARLWFNTAFATEGTNVFTKAEMDGMKKDKRHRKFPENFTIEVDLELVAADGQGGSTVRGSVGMANPLNRSLSIESDAAAAVVPQRPRVESDDDGL